VCKISEYLIAMIQILVPFPIDEYDRGLDVWSGDEAANVLLSNTQVRTGVPRSST